MADGTELLRAQTTEPFVLLQIGEPIPGFDGMTIPLVITYGNGLEVERATDLILSTAIELVTGRVHLECGDPEHDHSSSKEEMLHARREPPFSG